ncbi:MAG: haloacid dehalogenase [Ponticaulis sp.]|nr:haloacid dehalogenase [Ponticaulis sp.]
MIVWDLDGTIIDSRETIQNAMSRAFNQLGMDSPDYNDTRKIVGLSLDEACRGLLPPDASDKLVSDLTHEYKEAFVFLRTQKGFSERLYDGAVNLLQDLANENCLMGVATGKSRRGIDAVFGHHDLHRYFDTIWCADDGPGKPNPFMVVEAMKAVGVEVDQTVMVGDAIHDIIMGRSAGVITHGVTWGFGEPDELTSAGAHHVHETMPSLSSALMSFSKV